MASREMWIPFLPRLGFTFVTIYKALAQQAIRIMDLRPKLNHLLRRHSLIIMISIEVRRHDASESSSRPCSCVRRRNRDGNLY
jgi:hypothetical protein